MIYVLYILFGITLFQDVKYRGIHWSVFLLMLASTMIYKGRPAWEDIGVNLMFLLVLLSALTLYLSLKQGHIVNITKGYFSWGDILFLMVLTPLFVWHTYMLVFIMGTFGTLIVHVIVRLFTPQKNVPYAGYMAALTGVFLCFQSSVEVYFNSLIWP